MKELGKYSTAQEVMARLSIKRTALSQKQKAGYFPNVLKIGRIFLFSEEDILENIGKDRRKKAEKNTT